MRQKEGQYHASGDQSRSPSYNFFPVTRSSSAKIAHIVAIIEYVKPCASTILEETGSFNGHHHCTMYQKLAEKT